MVLTDRKLQAWRLSRRHALGLLSGAGAAVLVGPRVFAQDGGEPRAGGTLRIAQIGDPRFFNPARQLPFWAYGGIYDSLLRYDEEGAYVPHLAESYEVSDDSTAVTVNLQSGVTFHSGRPLTSEDVSFWLQTLQEPGTGAPYRAFALEVSAVETPDERTAIFRLNRPEAGILELLANFYIADREAYADIDRIGAGTGPFRFVEYTPGDQVVLERNEDYWGQQAYLDRIEVPIFGDQQAAVANLEAGSIDLTEVPLLDFLRLEEGGSYESQTILGSSVFNLWLQTRRPPFDNQLARQAMAFAINRERFNETVLRGQSQATNNPHPPNHWAFIEELNDVYPFDLERAAALFAEAGLPDGFEATVNVNSQDRDALGLAQILQSDLAEIGIELNLDAKDAPRWAEAADRGEFDVNIHAYGRAQGDPTLLFRGTTAWRPDDNPTGFTDPRYDELIAAQGAVLNREDRLPLVRDLVAYVQDQCFVIPVAPSVNPYMMQPAVQGLTLFPVGIVGYMEKVWLDG
jgi:peptide/nickel transport system substrate-binding protein